MNYKTKEPMYNNSGFQLSVKVDDRWYISRTVFLKVKGAKEVND
jgi:hypothetical protein